MKWSNQADFAFTVICIVGAILGLVLIFEHAIAIISAFQMLRG